MNNDITKALKIVRDNSAPATPAKVKRGPIAEAVDKKAFAKLAPPKNKITFADKIAGAKKSKAAKLKESTMRRVIAVLSEAVEAEKTMTPAQKAKREKIVKSMKSDKAGMKERYGSKWEDVMYATATKQAIAENYDMDEPADDEDEISEASTHALSDETTRKIIDGTISIYDAMTSGDGVSPEEQQALSSMYNDIAEQHGLQPDDDFEEVIDLMLDDLDNGAGNGELAEGMFILKSKDGVQKKFPSNTSQAARDWMASNQAIQKSVKARTNTPQSGSGKPSLDTIFNKLTQVVSEIYPDGDPYDYMAPWCRKMGIDYEHVDAAARAHGYKDAYAYWDSMAELPTESSHEQMTEMNLDTVSSYKKKSAADLDAKYTDLGKQMKRGDAPAANKSARQVQSRMQGLDRADKRLGRDQVGETSDKTLKTYIKKSSGDAINRRNTERMTKVSDPKIAKRNAGQAAAQRKLDNK